MKEVIIEPFNLLKVSDEALKQIEINSEIPSDPQEEIISFIKKINRDTPAGLFIGINPSTKEYFTFVPVIHNNQFFSSYFPDPIQLFFSLAYSNYEYVLETKDNIVSQYDQPSPVNFVNDYLYNWHLKYKISTVIFLHSTVEAFINYTLPDSFIYRQVYNAKKSEKFLTNIREYNKEQTEKYLTFKEKLGEVITQATGIDFPKEHKKLYDTLVNINTLRNEIIHLRSSKEDNRSYFEKVFTELVNIDLLPFVEAVEKFINIIRPNYIKLKSTKPDNRSTSIFKFSHYSAFKLDISPFLEILHNPAEKIILQIPKNEDSDFKTILNWILQNLNVMAEKDIIYFPKIKSDEIDVVEIEIIKVIK